MQKSVLALKERANRTAFTFSLKSNDAYCVTEAHNFDCRGGVLRTGPSIEKILAADGSLMTCGMADVVTLAKVPDYNVAKHLYQYKYCALTYTGMFYYQSEEGAVYSIKKMGIQNGAIAHCADQNGAYYLAIFGRGVNTLCNGNGTIKDIIRFDSLGAVCYLKHRIFFAVEKGGIAYTAPDNLTNVVESIQDGGIFYVQNNSGQIVCMRAFNNAIYVFFEKGIKRLDVAGSPRDFEMKTLNYDGGRIFGRTVCPCGESVIFMASDGIYRLHNDKVERILLDFAEPPVEETGKEGHAVWQDRAMISYTTADGEKTLVIYSDGKDAYYINALTALSEEEGGTALFLNEEKVICTLNDNAGTLFLGSVYRMETNFSHVGAKTLRKLIFKGEGTFELTLQTGRKKLTKTVTLDNGGAEVALTLRGEKFAFTFTPLKKMRVTSMTAEWKTVA